MPTSLNTRRPQGGLLKYSYLLLSLNVGTSLKLTPVQHSTQRLDLSQEASLISNAFDEAKALITSEAGDSLDLDGNSLLHNKTIKKLVNSIERWNFVEKRLQNGIANGDASYQKKITVFEETLSLIAASRVLLGSFFWRSHEDELALKELESSCLNLWEYDVAKTSLDNDGWLDCYSTLGDIYIRTNRLERAGELENNLITRMPWFVHAFPEKLSGSDISKERTLSVISNLSRVTREERRMISIYIKNAWSTAEILRVNLNELVGEFILADTNKKRINIYKRAQSAIEEILENFVQSSKVLQPRESSESAKNNEKSEITLLNEALRGELDQEASFYLSALHGIIEGGKYLLPGGKVQEKIKKENNNYNFQTEFAPKNRKNTISGLPPNVIAPLGFQSKDQVMQLFEYLFTYQSDKKLNIEENKILLATARIARKKALELEKSQGKDGSETKKTKNSSQKNKNKKSIPKKSFLHSHIFKYFIYISIGISSIVAIYAKYVYNLLHITKKEKNNHGPALLKNRLDIMKSDTDTNKSDKSDTNIVIIDLLKFLNTKNIIEINILIKEDLIIFMIKIYKKMVIIFNAVVIFFTPVFLWMNNFMIKFFERMEVQRIRRQDELTAKNAALTAWTTSGSPTVKASAKSVNSDLKKPVTSIPLKNTNTIPQVKKQQKSKKVSSKESKKLKIINSSKLSEDLPKILMEEDTQITHLDTSEHMVVPVCSDEISNDVTSNLLAVTDTGVDGSEVSEECSLALEECSLPFVALDRDDSDTVCNDVPNLDIRIENTDTYIHTEITDKDIRIENIYKETDTKEAELYENFYWGDEMTQGEGDWIEETRVKVKKGQNSELLSRSALLVLRQRQHLLQQQHDRKTLEAAFSKNTVIKDKNQTALLRVQKSKKGPKPGSVPLLPGSEKKRLSASGFIPESQVISQNLSKTENEKSESEVNDVGLKVAEKEMDFTVFSKATMKLKNILNKNNKLNININTTKNNADIISDNNFPPLPNTLQNNKTGYSDTRISENSKPGYLDTRISEYDEKNESENNHSSGDNSTDREDSISSEEGNSPRSRSLSYERNTSEEPILDDAKKTQEAQPNLYYTQDGGYVPMPMGNMMYTGDQVINNQGMMMMPSPQMFLLPPIYAPQGQYDNKGQPSQYSPHGVHPGSPGYPHSPIYPDNRQGQSPQYSPQGSHPVSPGYPGMRQYANDGQQYINQSYYNQMQNNRENQFYNNSNNMNININLDIRVNGYPGMNRMNSEPQNMNFQHMNEVDIVRATRDQIEYYFSPANLSHDKYLRSKMDKDGYVCLSEFASWNRILTLGASARVIYKSVQSSHTLEVSESVAITRAKMNKKDIYSLSTEELLNTKIRCIDRPLQWVLGVSGVDLGSLEASGVSGVGAGVEGSMISGVESEATTCA